MTENNKVSIIIPAYNEEVGIKQVLDRLTALNYHKNYEIIVVNDGSSDNTAAIVSEYPVTLAKHNVNKGYGAALKTGIRNASGNKVIMMDSDGQHDPKYIPQIISSLDEYDMVIGTRSKDSHQVKSRQFGKRIIRIIGQFLVEQKLPDYNSGYRGFDKETLQRMLNIMPNGFSFSTTSTLAYLKEGFTIGTFPIYVEERKGRKSNVKFIKDGSKTIMLILRIIMLFNPLKIFLPVSIIMSLFGVAFGTYGFIIAGRFSNSAILITMLGMFLFFIGLVADQISLLNRKY